MYFVYKHTTPSNKVYIGITCQPVNERWRNGEGYRGQIFYRAVKKYGWEKIKHEILFEGLTKEEAEAKEIELIKEYKSNIKTHGYNVENGGNSTGKHSEATKTKISLSNKGKEFSEESKKLMRLHHPDVSGEKNPNYGVKFSEEIRRRMSESKKGKQVGSNNPMYGRRHSEECKKIQSENRKGKCVGADNPKARSIEQLKLNGEHIKTYDCVMDAERALKLPRGGGGHISACAKGKLKSAYGFLWRYDGRKMTNEII